MPAYLISKQNASVLETLVFTLDNVDGEDEAIPVFTTEENAQEWLSGSEFEPDYEVAMLEDLPFIFWSMEICKEGIGHLILDPNRADQSAGKGQDTISLVGHLTWSATQLLSAHQRTES